MALNPTTCPAVGCATATLPDGPETTMAPPTGTRSSATRLGPAAPDASDDDGETADEPAEPLPPRGGGGGGGGGARRAAAAAGRRGGGRRPRVAPARGQRAGAGRADDSRDDDGAAVRGGLRLHGRHHSVRVCGRTGGQAMGQDGAPVTLVAEQVTDVCTVHGEGVTWDAAAGLVRFVDL